MGPEGGISPAERAALRESGAIEARLGPTVLRTSTAGAAAATILLSRVGRWLAPANTYRVLGQTRGYLPYLSHQTR